MPHCLRHLVLGSVILLGWALPESLQKKGAAIAQVVIPDTNSSSTTNTLVGDTGTFVITGGTQRLNTLFHSFTDFSPESQNVLFQLNNSQQAIEQVISRVTGTNSSFIDAQLALTGGNTPDLYLINPHGITFGANSSLSLPGSFTASTAETVLFEQGHSFSAIAPNSAPLLTVSTPTGLQFGNSPAAIALDRARLAVASTESLTLLGGNVVMTDGSLRAPGGHISLGGLSEAGIASTKGAAVTLSGERSNVTLNNTARVNVSAEQSGQIDVLAHNIQLLDGSRLQANIVAGGNLPTTAGGNITLNATGDTTLAAASAIQSEVKAGAVGQGGNINVTTQNLSLLENAQIIAGTNSTGTAGDVNIAASELILISGSSGGRQGRSAIFNNPSRSSNGQGGNISITANNLLIADGGGLSIEVLGAGSGGNITVTATKDINIDGISSGSSHINAEANRGSTGTGGNVTLNATNLNLTNGGNILLATEGSGDSGTLLIRASDSVNLTDTNADDGGSHINAESDRQATGSGGDVIIETTHLNIADGSTLSTETASSGDAGNIAIRASDTVNISSTRTPTVSRIDAKTSLRASGDGGAVTIETTDLNILGGGRISVETEGVGSGGSLLVSASGNITVSGANEIRNRSRIEADSEKRATGNGGNIVLETGSLYLSDSGLLSVETKGDGDAGNIDITAREDIILSGASQIGTSSRIAAAVRQGSTGQGGNLSIRANNLRILDGGRVSVETESSGDAGILDVQVTDTIEIAGVNQRKNTPSSLEAEVSTTATGNGGNLFLEARHLQVRNGGSLSVDTAGGGRGGNATIRAHSIELSGEAPVGNTPTQITATSLSDAPAGSLNIQTSLLSVADSSRIEVSSAGRGGAGNLIVNADQIRLDNNASLQALVVAGEQSNIILNATDLISLRRGSNIITNASGLASGGNIYLSAPIIIGLENSDIVANAVRGSGGNISLTTQGLFGLVFRDQLTPDNDITASSEFGIDGTVEVNNIVADPGASLVILPEAPVDADNQIQAACGSNAGSQFIESGRGGLPVSPSQSVHAASLWTDVRPVADFSHINYSAATESQRPETARTEVGTLVEAASWQMNTNGQIELSAATETATSSQNNISALSCNAISARHSGSFSAH
ncbi:MAG: beta strand repeat-containing protein [Phormidesmis sp.]